MRTANDFSIRQIWVTHLTVNAENSEITTEKKQAMVSLIVLYAFSSCCGKKGWEWETARFNGEGSCEANTSEEATMLM